MSTEQNVEAYRDKATDQEIYVGRTVAENRLNVARHDELYREASSLIKGLIMVQDKACRPLDSSSRQDLTRAVALFEEVIRINPGNWSAMWLLGKIYQRIADPQHSLDWFSRAHRVNADHPDVAREATIAAMEAGRPVDAVAFGERAVAINPGDAGLRANLALALLFSEKPANAQKVANEALAADPKDQITAHIVAVIDEVLSGVRPCPHHVRELQSKLPARVSWLDRILARLKPRR